MPNETDFPVVYDGSEQSGIDTMNIVACQMEVSPDDILLEYYSEGISEIDTGGLGGGKIFVGQTKKAKLSSGKYLGKDEDGKYHIIIESKNLKDPVGLVATIAHEISHIKLLGEDRLERNNEYLTDITTVIFGLGIFNANSAFRFNSGFDQWGYRKLGYLTQIQWGYVLAVYAHMRQEEDTEWVRFLSDTVKGNFRRSAAFIKVNADKMRL